MISLYEMIEKLFALLEGIADCGAMTDEEENKLDKLKSLWYTYYEKDLKGE